MESGIPVIQNGDLRSESGDGINQSGVPVNVSRDSIYENGTEERLTKTRPNGPAEPSPGLRPKADTLGQQAPPYPCGL